VVDVDAVRMGAMPFVSGCFVAFAFHVFASSWVHVVHLNLLRRVLRPVFRCGQT
jgi:hypothetical protein